jgi:hypothetical protein
MRASPRILAVTLLGILALGGCKGGGLTGNSSATGNSADQDQKQQPQQKKQSGANSPVQDTQPRSTVSGQPSAESDRGSPSAVAHHSVAEPGAPQGTAPDSSQKPAPKSPPSAPQHQVPAAPPRDQAATPSHFPFGADTIRLRSVS